MNVGQVEFAVIADGLDTVLGKVTELEGTLNGMSGRKYNVGGNIKRTAGDLRSIQRDMEHTLVNLGSRMQTFGRTLQTVTAPFNNILRGFTMGIGYRALNKVLDGLTGAFQRADILNTAEARIKELGLGKDLNKKFAIGTNKAATAMDNLDQAVQGLPTGLDEIVASMQVYVGASEDVEKSTRMAIAANNAYIASGVDATRKRFAERQLQNLMSGTELTTQQWDSLRKNIPLALNATAHEMKMTTGEMIDGLKNGRIEAEKFIDAFIKVGTEGKVAKSAQIMKQTWEALSSNISIAFSRMGANILDTMNSVTKKATGRTFLQHLLGVDKNGKDMGDGIKGIINDISESAQEWIKANPDKLVNFLNDLKNFDWKGLLGEIGNFAMFMGKMYGGMIKFLGGKNLARFMLWGNAIGKIITVMGGITRGAAGTISKILTGTGIFGAVKAIKGFGAVTDAMSSISWQGVASKAVSVAAIPAIAWSLKEVAIALQEFDKVDINWPTLADKLAKSSVAISYFATMAGALGALLSSTPIGWAAAAIEGAGVAAIASIAKTMKWIGEGLNAIADAQIPSVTQIEMVTDSMMRISEVFEAKNPFEAIGKMFDAWSKGAELGTITKISDAFKSIKQLSKIKIGTDAMERAKQNFADMGDFISGLETLFSKETKSEAAGTNGSSSIWRGNTTRYSSWAHEVSSFAEIVTNVNNAMGMMKPLLKTVNSLQKYYDKLGGNIMQGKSNFSWYSVTQTITDIANGMYGLINGDASSPLHKLKSVSEVTKGMDFQPLLTTVGIIPKIINKLTAIGEQDMGKVNLDNLDVLGEKINTFITKISGAFDSAGAGFGGVGGMATNAGAFLAGVDAVRKAINRLNNIPVAKDMTGVVSSVKTAIAQLREIGTQIIDISITIQGGVTDMVTPQITAVADAINAAMDSIKSQYKKSVTVRINNGGTVDNVTPAINRIAGNILSAINSIPSTVNKKVQVNVTRGFTNDPLGLLGGHTFPYSGGLIGKHGVIYRQFGGFIPRGTDSVPAMLTPGEWVINRTAASVLGARALQKMNHLDFAGAIKELSARAGQNIIPRGNIVNNTTNNTRNATVNLHNYNGGSMGTVRASRWAKSL